MYALDIESSLVGEKRMIRIHITTFEQYSKEITGDTPLSVN